VIRCYKTRGLIRFHMHTKTRSSSLIHMDLFAQSGCPSGTTGLMKSGSWMRLAGGSLSQLSFRAGDHAPLSDCSFAVGSTSGKDNTGVMTNSRELAIVRTQQAPTPTGYTRLERDATVSGSSSNTPTRNSRIIGVAFMSDPSVRR
jgi:hypothetical protein